MSTPFQPAVGDRLSVLYPNVMTDGTPFYDSWGDPLPPDIYDVEVVAIDVPNALGEGAEDHDFDVKDLASGDVWTILQPEIASTAPNAPTISTACPWCGTLVPVSAEYRRIDAATMRRLCGDCTDESMDAEQRAADGIGAS